MWTALRNSLGPQIKTFGGAVIAGAGFTVGASMVGVVVGGIAKGATKLSDVIDKQIEKNKIKKASAPYVQSMP